MGTKNWDGYDDLKERANTILNDENAWTFMDDDPSVAWGDPESCHGRLAAIYLEAGWEGCYHDSRTTMHFNIKVGGNAAYQALRKAVDESGLDYDAVMERVHQVEADELDMWWEDMPYRATDDPSTGEPDSRAPLQGIYSCGRSGGYLNANDYLMDPDTMIDLAKYCAESADYFNGAEYGVWVADEAVERYRDDAMAALASPRIERIEA